MVGFSVSRKLSQVQNTSEEDLNFHHKTRFIILIIVTLCLSIAQSDTLTLNFTIICMSGDGAQVGNHSALSNLEDMEMTLVNGSGTLRENVEHMEHKIADGRYNYTPSEKSLLFSLVAVGAMVAVYPVMLLIGVSNKLLQLKLILLFPSSEIRIPLCLFLDGNAFSRDYCSYPMDGIHWILPTPCHEIPPRCWTLHWIHTYWNLHSSMVHASSKCTVHCRIDHVLPGTNISKVY